GRNVRSSTGAVTPMMTMPSVGRQSAIQSIRACAVTSHIQSVPPRRSSAPFTPGGVCITRHSGQSEPPSVIGDLLAGFGQPQGEKERSGTHLDNSHANSWQDGGDSINTGRRGNPSGYVGLALFA